MWSFLNNRGPVTVSPPNNNHPAVTKVAGFHVSNYSRGILDLASNPCHRQFPDFINRSNSASELVVCSAGEKLPRSETVNRSKSAGELSPCTSMAPRSDDVSPSRVAGPSSSPVKAEKPASPSPKKRRCNLQKQQQQQQQLQQQQTQQSDAVVAVSIESGDEEDDSSSDDDDMVPLKVRQRNDSVTSEDSFIIFMDSEDGGDGADEDNEDEEDEEDESDTESEQDESQDSDGSGDDTEEEICFANSPRCDSCGPSKKSKKVHWAPDDKLCSFTHISTWVEAHQEARSGPWLIFALDTMRFKTRITSTKGLLDNVLSTEHRARIYEERFKNQDY